MALWGYDTLVARVEPSRLLVRSAGLLRASIVPALSSQTAGARLDRMVRLVLDTNGPRYVREDQLHTLAVRRVAFSIQTTTDPSTLKRWGSYVSWILR